MQAEHKRNVLVVDDDDINLMILAKGVQEVGYDSVSFNNGPDAWNYLQKNPEGVDIVILDKMMPKLDGMEILRRIKSDARIRHLPVIIQTGDVGVEQMRKGLEAGAYYYLTKPFHPSVLTAILHSAANECLLREELKTLAHVNASLLQLMKEGTFHLRTHTDARNLAMILAQSGAYPEFLAMGLMELFNNAIEHGNLEIGYERKRECMLAETWEQEVRTRLENPLYANRKVTVRCEPFSGGAYIIVTDEGRGFDWRAYSHGDDALQSLADPNGRGIAKAQIMLEDVRWLGEGNEVHCTLRLAGANKGD